MDDEYGKMDSAGEVYIHPTPLRLEAGQVLKNAKLCYNTYGKLNDARDNVLVVNHALTGNSSLHGWWGELLGPGKAFDTSRYFIVCSNILGSCYGSTGPMDINPDTGRQYRMAFPDISVRDTVNIQIALLKSLNVKSVKCVVGGSFGGMQTLEFMLHEAAPSFIRSAAPIACGAHHTAWQIGISETQRQAIYADANWLGGNYEPSRPPTAGLNVARQIGMVTYRTAKGFESKFGRSVSEGSAPFGSQSKWAVKSYLEYQGEKFLTRFDPITYIKLTEQMDSHDVGRHRGGVRTALAQCKIPALVVGISSDVLYPLHEQLELYAMLGSSAKKLVVVESDAGHDGFLLEQEQVGKALTDFLASID
jgi:homoserine O-acetyltransferase